MILSLDTYELKEKEPVFLFLSSPATKYPSHHQTTFTRQILTDAARLLPQTVLAILTLMLFCAALAFLLVKTVGIDPLTAYLATSPGGMDSAAIIAASSKVDVPFVMALQTVRFMVVLLVGPTIARFAASRMGHVVPMADKEVGSAKLIAQVKEDEDEFD